jgi:hypothetical protein
MKTTLIFLGSILISSLAFSQTKQVSGVVLGHENTPVPGMNVVELGTSNGTATNAEGKFTLTIPGNKDVYLLVAGIDIQLYVKVVPDENEKKISLRNDVRLRKESRKIRKEWEARSHYTCSSR